MANRVKFTPEKRKAFIDALYENPNVTEACKTLKISTRCAYDHKQADGEFSAAWDKAVETGMAMLEDIAFKRAKDGSDTMLIFMLKAYKPKKYAEKHQVDVDANVTVDFLEIASKARQAALERRRSNGGSHDDLDSDSRD